MSDNHMTAEEIEQLFRYLDGELPKDEQRNLEALLMVNSELRSSLKQMVNMKQELASFLLCECGQTGSRHLTDRVMGKLEETGRPYSSPSISQLIRKALESFTFRPVFAAACCLALIAINIKNGDGGSSAQSAGNKQLVSKNGLVAGIEPGRWKTPLDRISRSPFFPVSRKNKVANGVGSFSDKMNFKIEEVERPWLKDRSDLKLSELPDYLQPSAELERELKIKE